MVVVLWIIDYVVHRGFDGEGWWMIVASLGEEVVKNITERAFSSLRFGVWFVCFENEDVDWFWGVIVGEGCVFGNHVEGKIPDVEMIRLMRSLEV